ncbi:hypothetical protein BC830DRAFT_1083456 [Chytriomyces sp. MP71]|nr:hypothetical protein BC830DRAFT_1083456 [Chytriomyces sp. MP71]
MHFKLISFMWAATIAAAQTGAGKFENAHITTSSNGSILIGSHTLFGTDFLAKLTEKLAVPYSVASTVLASVAGIPLGSDVVTASSSIANTNQVTLLQVVEIAHYSVHHLENHNMHHKNVSKELHHNGSHIRESGQHTHKGRQHTRESGQHNETHHGDKHTSFFNAALATLELVGNAFEQYHGGVRHGREGGRKQPRNGNGTDSIHHFNGTRHMNGNSHFNGSRHMTANDRFNRTHNKDEEPVMFDSQLTMDVGAWANTLGLPLKSLNLTIEHLLWSVAKWETKNSTAMADSFNATHHVRPMITDDIQMLVDSVVQGIAGSTILSSGGASQTDAISTVDNLASQHNTDPRVVNNIGSIIFMSLLDHNITMGSAVNAFSGAAFARNNVVVKGPMHRNGSEVAPASNNNDANALANTSFSISAISAFVTAIVCIVALV